MAKVKSAPGSVDWQLDWSLRQWGRLPEIEAEINQWDPPDQLHFLEEWPLEEERLLYLTNLATNGKLRPGQRARYEQLQCLVARNRPIIERLRES
jgi:hypothetical protein